jgi:uncharacterized protein YfaS (alpha-2-macroglobulin family)
MRVPMLLAALTASGLAVSQQPALQVLRVSPSGAARPTDEVTVTFDRPVAGQLDATVDPRSILTIAPAVEGRLEWRDPITLRLTPSGTLTPGTTYTVTVANGFTAMDGSRLAEPYRFTFRVGGPRVLDGTPVGDGDHPRFVRPDSPFELLVSAPVDLAVASRLVSLKFAPGCAGPPTVSLTAVSQRPLAERDPWRYRYAGGGDIARRALALRRVVRFVPDRPLPTACAGALFVPPTIEESSQGTGRWWPFDTYGPLGVAGVRCTNWPACPAGYAVLRFTTPVRGSEVLRAVHLSPAARFTVEDTTDEHDAWMLEGALRPRTTYTITVDSALVDVFGQRITGARTATLATSGYQPSLDYPTGRMLVERGGFRTIAVRHVNVDTLLVTTAAVPPELEARVLAAPEWNIADVWPLVASGASTRTLAVQGRVDVPLVSAVRVPTYNAARPGAPTLSAVRIAPLRGDTAPQGRARVALVQVTDLGVAAKLGAEEAVVWVTTLHDGLPAAGAAVTLHDRMGRVRGTAVTDSLGLARITGLAPDTATAVARRGFSGGFQGYVAVARDGDRALVGFDAYSWELSPWRFNVSAAGDVARLPAAAAVFTERGIYRPGEVVHAKAIVRTGSLGALRAPARGDSLRWTFSDREDGTLRDTVVAASAFGTAEQALPLGADLPLGTYRVGVQLRRDGAWQELATATYRVAEYRPPEFLVGVTGDTAGRMAGDTLRGTVEARYLFGAPMGRAAVSWSVRRVALSPWALRIPGTDGWELGESGWWWEDEDRAGSGAEVTGTGTDTLDATGHLVLRAPLGAPRKGLPARVTLAATITDVNRQAVTGTLSAVVHPAAFYLAARAAGDEYFWRAGTAQRLDVVAVRPDGRRVAGVAVRGTIVRREWHQVQRQREGLDERVGEWVADTIAHCDLTTGAEAAPCAFTPAQGGSYIVSFKARDGAGREASTSFYRWAVGRGWVPWGDENQFKMDVIPDRTRYDVGDTATVLLASPFTGAEAWVTVEREGLLEQRRVRITSGATSIKLALTEAYVPNAFVSVVVVKGRSAPPGGIADPGRPGLRIGYAELRVTPGVKRLDVTVTPLAAEYRPGDSARVRLRVRDARGAGRRAEVTLWAVDEGVLALTGYRTPDPVALIYRPRGVGMRLASDLVSVAAQVLEEEGVSIKGEAEPGGGGGLEGGDVLRSRFASTAFFLGSVVTGEDGNAVAAAKLPDNLTTFRLMAVAVTEGDRYGSGESSLLVTRPLLARPALPRFLRRDDHVAAGVVVNQRAGGTPTVQVRASLRGVSLGGPALQTATLAAGRGTEVRFAFRDTASDTASFRFDVTDGHDSDAVLTRLPVRSAFVPRAHTAAGTVGLTAGVTLDLPADIDPARSRLVFSVGTTPLAVIEGMYRALAVYPFDCSEQLSDELLALAALQRSGADPSGRSYAPPGAQAGIAEAVRSLTRRQRADGGIGLWAADDWTTPWLSAHAGLALLAARDAGAAVDDSVLARLATYLFESVHRRRAFEGPLYSWFSSVAIRYGEDVAAVDYLSRLGRPDVASENDLVRVLPQLAWEDRVRLAEVVARRGARDVARRILAPVWAAVRVEGNRALVADSVAVRAHYFWSWRRPLARLLSATLAADSAHPLVGPLVETLVQQGRAAQHSWWNTQDYAAAVAALADFGARQRVAARRGFTVAGGGQVLYRSAPGGEAMREVSRDLAGLLADVPGGGKRLALTIAAPSGEGAVPLYYYVTVHEVPRQRPVTPDQQGIQVERWYEDYTTGRPIVSVAAGALVRVRLRVRLPAERRFLALTDPLPAGLEAVDLSLRTVGGLPGPAVGAPADQGEGEAEGEGQEPEGGGYLYGWYYGCWDAGWWSPFDHRELRDDRVVYVATYLWRGTFTATYVARATTPGVYVLPPAHAEEMYNPAVQGRSDGGTFTVTPQAP